MTEFTLNGFLAVKGLLQLLCVLALVFVPLFLCYQDGLFFPASKEIVDV